MGFEKDGCLYLPSMDSSTSSTITSLIFFFFLKNKKKTEIIKITDKVIG